MDVKNSKGKRALKLFAFTQMSFAILGINSQQSIQKLPFNPKILMVLVLYGLLSISHLIYLMQAIGSDKRFAEYTDSIFGTAACISVAFYYAITVLNKSILFKFIDDCKRIMEKSEFHSHTKTDSTWILKLLSFRVIECKIKRIVWRSQSQNRKMQQNHISYHNKTLTRLHDCAKINYLLFCIFYVRFSRRCFWAATSNVVSWNTQPFQKESLKEGRKTKQFLNTHLFFFPQRLPFNWNNPLGFLFAICLQYILIKYYYFYVASLSSFGIGAFLIFTIGSIDIKDNLTAINDNAKHRKNKEETFEQLKNYIETFSHLKQLSWIRAWLKSFLTDFTFRAFFFQKYGRSVYVISTDIYGPVYVVLD